MAPFNLVIRNGFLVSPYSIVKADIGVRGEKIAMIGRPETMPPSEKVLDASGLYIIPGCIDTHVHFREPLREDKENWITGSRSAACGGVTTVLEMPESVEPGPEALTRKMRLAEEKSVVDFGLYGRPRGPEDVQELFKIGVIGYKILLGYEQFALDDGSFFQILKGIGSTSLPAVVHAEDITIIRELEKELLQKGMKDIFAHGEARANFVEEEAVAKSLVLARAAGCKLHIAHLSTKEGAELIRTAKRNRQAVTAETCPQYLLLEKTHLEKLGPYGKINPPVRGTKEDIAALWLGLRDGTVDCIATDHAPHLIEEKELGWKNIFDSAPGVIGVQTMLPLMLTEVNRGRLSLTKLVELTSANPAKIFNIYPRKGSIQIGSDADLVIINLKKRSTIRIEDQQSKMPFTPYNGWKIQGTPRVTIVRGQVAAEDGKVRVDPGYGKLIKPDYKPG